MTEHLTVDGSLLAADPGARTVTYRLLPYGEAGRTSRGLVTASRGSVTIPDPSSVVLNVEHDRTRPVARATSIVEDNAGLVATFAVADTTAGSDLLAETAAGLRPGVSVELDDVVIRGGALVRSVLVAAGAVVSPAFPSALLVATDTPPDPSDPIDPDTDTPAPDTDTPAPDDDGDETGDTMPDETATAAAPAGLVATATPPARTPMTLPRVAALLAAVSRGDRSPDLLAALTDITYTANDGVGAPAYIGEAWSGSPYERQIVPLLAAGTLSSYKVIGWRWAVAPVGAEYAGDKAAVASNAAATAPVEYPAQRWAGAHDVDRKFTDFGDADFWASYWAAMAASYSKWSDDEAAAALVAGATAVTPAGTGVVAALVAASLAVIPHGTPNYAILGASAFAELVERDPLAFLSGSVSLASADGNVGGLAIRTSARVATDQVVVGTRNAATWYELGSTPIRVEAVNVANGGVDVGAFGYGAVGFHNALGVAKATVTQPLP